MQERNTSLREPGLDLLRLLSMLLVIVLHLLGQGGVLAALTPGSGHYWAAWALETAAYCAVDCYALLTGYLLISSRCASAPLLRLWLQVFCYSAGITALFACFRESVTPLRFLQACLPVSFTQYWYFTAYFGVYCCAPFVNRLLRALSPAAFRRLLATALSLLSLLPTLTGADPFVTGKGYSFLWLLALYLLGAYLRLCPPRPRRAREYLAGYLLFVGGLLLLRGIALALDTRLGSAVSHGGWFLTYPSPLVLGSALCLFGACRSLRPGLLATRIIEALAPVSFGIYLLHAQPFVFHRLLAGAAVPLLALPAWQFGLSAAGAALGIFLLGAAVDWLRIAVFRLLGLDGLCRRLGEALDRRLPPP